MNMFDLNYTECEKLDPQTIAAYFTLKYGTDVDPEMSDTTLCLDNSWGTTCLDIEPLIKAGETITHLFLTPADNPVSLQYNREDYGLEGASDGGIDCINGDDLSHIISMTKLKDVGGTPISGDVYMFNGTNFMPFNLQSFVDTTNATLGSLRQSLNSLSDGLGTLNQTVQQNYTSLDNKIDGNFTTLSNQLTALSNTVNGLQTALNNLTTRVASIESQIARPAGVPESARIAYSNVNFYSDKNWNGSGEPNKANGIFAHNPANNITNDEAFA